MLLFKDFCSDGFNKAFKKMSEFQNEEAYKKGESDKNYTTQESLNIARLAQKILKEQEIYNEQVKKIEKIHTDKFSLCETDMQKISQNMDFSQQILELGKQVSEFDGKLSFQTAAKSQLTPSEIHFLLPILKDLPDE